MAPIRGSCPPILRQAQDDIPLDRDIVFFAAADMESKQVGPGFAAEILGVDLSAAMLDGDFDAIKRSGLRTSSQSFAIRI